MGGVLGKKLLRDLWENKVVLVVLIGIVTIGVSVLIASKSVYFDLYNAREDYYRAQRLADFSVDLKRAPRGAVEIAQNIPNVEQAQGRIVLGALLDLPNLSEPLNGQVISLPMERRPVLNDVILRSGTWFSGGDLREAILNNSFAEANGILPGHRIRVQMLDEQHEVLVVGTAMSPEFVYLIPPDGGIAPDPARFGVLYMPEEFVQESGDLEGAFNQIIGRVYDRSPLKLANALDLAQDRLDSWGVINLTPVHDQPSVRFLQDELAGLKVSSTIMPTIFLVVALLILNVLMNRMVVQQRSIIGTLKALGRSTPGIAMHYISYGIMIGIIGALCGIFVSTWQQKGMVALYKQFYQLPDLRARFYPQFHVMGMIISVVFACAGTISGVVKAARLQPAEAMRPPPPERGGKVFLENIGPLWSYLSFKWKLVLRAIFRNPFRSSVTFGTSFVSTALIFTTFASTDALDYLMDHQFKALAHEDITIATREPIGVGGEPEMRSIPGITSVEPQLNIVCDLINGAHRKRAVVTGLPENNTLSTPLDADGNQLLIPSRGLLLSEKLARILGVEVGDTVSMRPLLGRRERVEAPVVGVVDTYLGTSAWARIDYLSRLLGEEWVANSLLGTVEGFALDQWDGLYEDVKRRPTVIGISRRERALEQIQGTFGETQGAMLGILIGFAGFLAFGSVLNNAFVSLNEREREVSTYRVLGYTPGEVASILRGEIVVLSALGIGLGLLGGIGLTHALSAAYDTELFRFPVVIEPFRLVQAAFIMTMFIGGAQLISRVLIQKLDWLRISQIKE